MRFRRARHRDIVAAEPGTVAGAPPARATAPATPQALKPAGPAAGPAAGAAAGSDSDWAGLGPRAPLHGNGHGPPAPDDAMFALDAETRGPDPESSLPAIQSLPAIHWALPGFGSPRLAHEAASTETRRPPATPLRTGTPLLGELLVEAGAVTSSELATALDQQRSTGKRLGESLVELGFITERELVEALGTQTGRPVVDLRREVPAVEAVARLPEALAREYEVVPIRETPDGLEIAVTDVAGPEVQAVLEAAVGGPVVFVLAPYSEIRRVIDQAYVAVGAVDRQIEAFEISTRSDEALEEAPRLVVDDKAPVVQVVNLLITQALRERASDVHLEPQQHAMRVRFRVDGVMREVTSLPESMIQALVSRIKIMAGMNIVERRRAQDGQITVTIDGRPVDVRVSTIATIWGEKAVLRILDTEHSLISLSQLGMNTKTVDDVQRLVRAPFGMIACAGPTGSGKTTTLYAALNEINDPGRNITTIEDPVEYVLPSINQIQINAQAGITFAGGLRAILRQDPDVILVGEVRDVETARIAVQSALTGHLVLSSLHATDAATAMHRLRDMGIESFLLSSAVSAILSQRLVRRICEHCQEPYELSAVERVFYDRFAEAPKAEFIHGAGCNICSHTGYLGRIGAYELLQMSEEIRALLVTDASTAHLHDTAVAQGMRPLRDEVLRMVGDDVTTISEAIRCVSSI